MKAKKKKAEMAAATTSILGYGTADADDNKVEISGNEGNPPCCKAVDLGCLAAAAFAIDVPGS